MEPEQLVGWIQEATQAGARKGRACAEAGLTRRTLQRWTEKWLR